MARTDRDSQYGSGSYGSYSSSQNTSNRSQSYGGGADDRKQAYRTSTVGRTNTKKAAAIKAKNKIKQDMEDFANYTYQKPTGLAKYNLLAQAMDLTGLGKKTHEVNKSYYTRNVIGKTNPKTGKPYSANVQEYKDYLAGRGSGDLDAMGRTITRDNDGGGSDFVVEKNVGGKTILTTEKKVAADAETKKEYDQRVTKKRGRRKTIKTGSLGVTRVSSDYSLGKPTLLGKV
jgi:hypothetical protein